MTASKYRIYFLLQRVSHGLKKKADTALLEADGMSTAQAAVMSLIAGEDGVSQSYLASRLKRRESAIATMANRLLKAGYITRMRSDSDGRAWVLKPTDKGLSALDAMSSSFAAINGILDEAFELDDLKSLARGLHAVLDKLEEPDGE